MLLDELLAWLTEAQALLHAKTKDAIPEDLTTVEALVREHLVGLNDWVCGGGEWGRASLGWTRSIDFGCLIIQVFHTVHILFLYLW